MKRFYLTIVYMLSFVIFLVMLFFLQFLQYINTPIALNQHPLQIEIPKGVTLSGLTDLLSKKHAVTSPRYFKLLARMQGVSTKLQAGEYEFELGVTPRQMLSDIARGKVKQHSITFIAGWTFDQIMQVLDKHPMLNHRLKDLPARTIMSRLGHPNLSPEGQFYPDTYNFAKGTEDVVILQYAYKRMQKSLQDAWLARDKQFPYHSRYEVLIVASLLEKETALPSERRLIAGIINNRLQKNMPLQMDPTVIYGLGPNYKGKLTTRDLRQQGPYNTYTEKGLPPTPIAAPSQDAIEAALHPLSSHYLYFVAKGDGHHQFSSNLTEHNKAIKKYILQKQENT